ncbi:hypothetical protein F66182_12845, partial [Fusarium sp. NRRL 66182]
MILETISEGPESRRSSAKSSNEKKWSWFGKHKSYVQEENGQEATLPSAKTAPAGSISIEAPIDMEDKKVPRRASAEKSRSSFLRIFSKKKIDKTDSDHLTGDSSHDQDDALRQIESNDTALSHVPVPSSNRTRRPSGANQNWFARFFHVKPALRIIAFKIPKAKIRKEVYRTLREWKVYGMD